MTMTIRNCRLVKVAGACTKVCGDSETFSVWLSKAPSADVTVGLTLDTGNSVALTLDPLGPLTFPSGAWDENNAQTVTVSVPDNTILEADGIQRINLMASGGSADGATESVAFDFNDNDASALEVTLAASPLSVIEGGTITVTATLSGALQNAVTIDLTDTHITTEPADYDPLASITIPGGLLTGSGDLVTNDDDLAESDETFTLALGDLPAGLIAWGSIFGGAYDSGRWRYSPSVGGVGVRGSGRS